MLTLGQAQEELGHQVTYGIIRAGTLHLILRERGVDLLPLSLFGPLVSLRLIRWLKKHPVDLIHTHLTGAARIGASVASTLNIPCVAHLHIYRAASAYLQVADYPKGKLISVSQDLAKWFQEQLPIPPDRLFVVPNATAAALHGDALRPKDELITEVQNSLGLPPSARILTLAGRLSAEKGQDIILRAMPSVLKVFPDTHLLLAGVCKRGDPTERHLRQLAKQLNISPNVHFLGFRRDVVRLMRVADICLLPSRHDVFPLVGLEAMRLGCCLLSSNVGGLPEMIQDGLNGLLLSPDSPDSWSGTILRLLQDDELRHALGSRAEAMAARDFIPSVMAQRVSNVYEVTPE